jgi:hypothetical protein
MALLEQLLDDLNLTILSRKMQRSSSVDQARCNPYASVNQVASNVHGSAENSNMKRGTTDVVSACGVKGFQSQDGLNGWTIFQGDGPEEFLDIAHVDLFGPFTIIDGVEATRHGLTTRVLLDETVNPNNQNECTMQRKREDSRDAATDVLFILFLLQLPFFIIFSFWAKLTAIFQALLHSTEERRVPVQPPSLVLGVECRVHAKIGGVDELINTAGIPAWTIWDVQHSNVVVVHFKPTNGHISLEISFVYPFVSVIVTVEWIRATTQLPTTFEEHVAASCISKLLKDEKTGKSFDASNRTFINL